jgi:hypothetical protein
MGVATAPTFDDGFTQDDIPSAPGTARRASFDQAFSDLPYFSILRSQELLNARAGITAGYEGMPAERLPPAKRFSPEDAGKYMAERGLEAEFTFDREYNERELTILAERKIAELKRADILSRADGGAVGRFGIMLATQLLDPLAVGSAFVPVVGEARYARLLAGASGAVGRAGVRAGVGAAEGAVGAAILEPLIFAAKLQEQADYTAADSLLNIAIGSVFGGGLHVAGGAVGDIGRSGRETAAAARVADLRRVMEQQEALNAPTPFTALESYERRLTVADVEARMEDLYKARRADLAQAAADNSGDENMQLLFGTTRREAAAAELNRLDSAWMRGKAAPDRAKILAGEDGPLWRDLADAERLDNLTAVEARIAELELARPAVEARLRAAEAEQPTGALFDELEAMRQTAQRDANRELRAIDGELFKLKPVAESINAAVSPSARVTALRAAPMEREAALRSSVAQAVSDQPIEARPIFDRSPEAMREASDRLSDPDQRPMTNPESVVRADAVLAAGDRADLAAIEQQVSALDEQIKAMQAEAKLMGDDAMVAAIDDEMALIADLERQSNDATNQANMLVVCAARHAA